MSKPKIIKFFLLVSGALYLIFGLEGLFIPETILGLFDIEPAGNNALFELRGSYGGINLVVGIFLLYGAFTLSAQRSALTIVALLNEGYVVGRLFSLVLSGAPDGWLLAVLAAEMLFTAAAFYLLLQKSESLDVSLQSQPTAVR